MTSEYFQMEIDQLDRLSPDRLALVKDAQKLLEDLQLTRLKDAVVTVEGENLGLVMNRNDDAVRLFVGVGEAFTTVGFEIKGTPVLMPRVSDADVVPLISGLLTGELLPSVLFLQNTAAHVNVVDSAGKKVASYGLGSSLLLPFLAFRRRLLMDVSFI